MGLFNLGYKQLLNSFLMTKMNLWTLFYKLKRFFGPMAIPGTNQLWLCYVGENIFDQL